MLKSVKQVASQNLYGNGRVATARLSFGLIYFSIVKTSTFNLIACGSIDNYCLFSTLQF